MHQSAAELMDAADQVPTLWIHRLRRRCKGFLPDFHHFSDPIHQKTESFYVRAYHDVDGKPAVCRFMESQALAKIHSGNNLSTQIDQAQDHRGRERHRSYFLIVEHFLDLFHLNPEQQPVKVECGEFLSFSHMTYSLTSLLAVA